MIATIRNQVRNSSTLRCIVLVSSLSLLLFRSSTSKWARPSLNHRTLESQVPIAGAVVATMTTNSENDIKELCLALKSLSFLRGGGTGHFKTAPVLVFNEDNLSEEQKQFLMKCTTRPMAFPVVYLNGVYPDGFDAEAEWETFAAWTDFRVLPPRDKWSYSQMVRFWSTNVWKHPAIQQFSTVMKIDSDACFIEQRDQNENKGYLFAPGLPNEFVYQTNFDNIKGGNPKYVEGLYDFALGYIEKEGITPANNDLFDLIKASWEESGKKLLPFFQTNMEIGRVEFFHRPEVAKWHDAVAEQEPFGVFRKRWGDHHIRVFTMAMFAKPNEVFLTPSTGYLHGRERCAKNFIDEIYERRSRNESQ